MKTKIEAIEKKKDQKDYVFDDVSIFKFTKVTTLMYTN
jgi:hypothetical protein